MEKISDTHTEIKSTRCRLQNSIRSHSFEHLEGALFTRDMGDAIVLYECRSAIMQLSRSDKLCYNDVKLTGSGFIDRETHVIKFNSNT